MFPTKVILKELLAEKYFSMVCGVSLRNMRKIDRWRTKQELAGLKKYNIQRRALKIFQEAWTTIQWRLLKEISGKFSLASSGCVQLFKNKTTVFLASCIRMHSATGQEGEVHIYIPVCLNIMVSSVLVFCITLALADGVTVHSVTL